MERRKGLGTPGTSDSRDKRQQGQATEETAGTPPVRTGTTVTTATPGTAVAAERTEGTTLRSPPSSAVNGSFSWPCWQTANWTAITPVYDRDKGSLWAYLDGTSQNDGGLYQLRGWEQPEGTPRNVTRRWKASE